MSRSKDAPVIERGMVAIYEELVAARRWRERERRETPEHLAELEAAGAPLHRMGAASVLRIPALAIPFTKTVPAEYWHAVALGMAELRCMCEAKLQLMAAEPAGCECGRWFLFTGQSVRVAVFENDPD